MTSISRSYKRSVAGLVLLLRNEGEGNGKENEKGKGDILLMICVLGRRGWAVSGRQPVCWDYAGSYDTTQN